MIRIATEGAPALSVSDCELTRPEPSYTLDTVHFFQEQFTEDVRLHWLIGADQVADFDRWYRVEELLDVCRICVMVRAGYPLPEFNRLEGVLSEAQIAQLKHDFLPTPRIDLSSTEIRRQLAQGQIDPEALPDKVLDYIAQHHLYGYLKS
jgi:nicotinate-nucleotide adenylyltransferase